MCCSSRWPATTVSQKPECTSLVHKTLRVYYGAVNLRFGLIIAGLSLVPWMEGRVCLGASGDKPIRLHNETVLVRPQASAAPTGLQGPAFGLFLVQFTGPLLPAWREELRAQGTEMLRYVSDDAFVARCRGT